MNLKPKLALFALIVLVVPVLSILLASAIFIYRNHLVDNWRYLEQIAAVIADDIKGTEARYAAKVSELAADEYVNAKLYVHHKYRDYLNESTMAWDTVPLRDFVAGYSLANGIETTSVYENTNQEFKRALLVGNATNVPYTMGMDTVENRSETLYYDQFLNSLYLNCVSPVYSGDITTGLILFQRAFDNNYFYNYLIKYDVDIGLVVAGDVLYDTSNGGYRDRVRELMESRTNRSYFRSDGDVFHIVLQPIVFGQDLDGAIATISKGHPIFGSGGVHIVALSLVGIASIIVAVLLFFLWGSQLIRTIQSLFDGTNEVSRGNLDHQISVDRKDELGALAHNFNEMVRTIHDDQEILEQRNAKLHLMNHYIDAVFQSLEVNTLVINPDYRPVLMNQNARDSLHPPSDGDLESIFEIPFFADRRSEFTGIIDDVLGSGTYKNISEIRYDQAIYSVDLFPITDSDDRVSGAIIIMIDITYREAIKEELLKSQQVAALGQISAALAHELNNPISIILNHVELVQTKKLTEEEESTFLARIHSEILRIGNLIGNLLQFSRNEALSTESTDVHQLLLQIFAVFAPILQKKGIRHEVVNDARRTTIRGNPTLLKQLFLNITKNAIESIQHDQGSLTASLRNRNGELDIAIADNGVGMPEAVVAQIFDPFFTSKAHPNVGLGLSLCREIVQKHGGTIAVVSREATGTTITVAFPLGDNE